MYLTKQFRCVTVTRRNMLNFIWDTWRWMFPPSTLPPGPRGLPVVGALPYLGRDVTGTLETWAREYGPVFSANFGSRPVVFLNGFDVIKEALVTRRSEFSGRPYLYSIHRVFKGKGIHSVDYGPCWRHQRQFTEKLMYEENLEAIIQRESRHLTDRIQTFGGRPFDPAKLMNVAAANIMCSVLFGERYDFDNEDIQRLLSLISDALKLANGAFNFIWIARFFPSARRFDALADEILKTVEKIVKPHLDSYDPTKTRHFLDAYMHKIHQSPHSDTFNTDQLMSVVLDVILAGSQNATTMMKWCLLYLATHQDVQTTVYSELQQVLENNPLSYDLRPQLPYTEATVLEVIRRNTGRFPLGASHATTCDVTFRGYVIPKSTYVSVNLNSVFMDEKLWPEPMKFRPQRFLAESGEVKEPEYFMPFGLGDRSCMGEGIARRELFTFVASLVNAFHWKFPEEKPGPNLQEKVYAPPQFEVCAVPRRQ
ncbi:cytochrome P450 2C42-like [Lingula anatina]|uniref:Cytochrome P450 2C42-like n=1 Tax=Lingula anatina TaxID=7574 RepID=A0A1S3J3H3_LINAN|nr:cytochrome P450 2C42-like [Lingula anatina]|eukprot:XP_013404967.1 cytochrome P450 2C42-like [Lingula anatina]